MRDYWLHRISYCAYAAYPLMNQGYLTIGFGDILKNEPDFASKVQRNDINFDECYSKTYRPNERSRWFLLRFLKDFKKEDIVIVPSWGTFYAFEIIGMAGPITDLEGQLENLKDWRGRQLISRKDGGLFARDENNVDSEVDLGFYVKVRPLIDHNGNTFAPRDGFMSNNLLKKLKYRGTNLDITDQKADIDEAIRRVRENDRIDFYEKVKEKTIVPIRDAMVKEINDRKFEKLVQYYFEKQGAHVETPAKNSHKAEEGDADVIASFDRLDITILVQVKQHEDVTGEYAVQQIKEYVARQSDDGSTLIGWVISSGDGFSERAQHEANQGNRIRLIDGKEFAEMLLDVGFSDINKVLS